MLARWRISTDGAGGGDGTDIAKSAGAAADADRQAADGVLRPAQVMWRKKGAIK